MSELAKSSRKAMQAKAKRLSATTTQKVDSSTWSPPAELDADVKTGARPLVRRIYKSGGKVEGMAAKKRADRAARKSGGRTAPWVDDLINRDVRTANEAREGKKHVGAFKNGGRAKHATKGKVNPMTQDRTPRNIPAGQMVDAKDIDQAYYDMAPKTEAQRVGSARRDSERAAKAYFDTLNLAASTRDPNERKKVMENADRAARSASAASEDYQKTRQQAGYKKGGEAGHPDVALDKALIKKMIKPSAMKDAKCYGGKAKKAGGGMLEASKKAMLVAADPHMKGAKKMTPEPVQKPEDQKKAKGGSVFSGNSTTKVPGVVGGRKAHKRGGKAKGKTNININIMPQAGGPPMPPIGLKPPMPPVMPPVAPPAGAPPMGGAGADPALLAALAGGIKGGAGAPPMPMPMPRKSGGRTIHVINHASGGGLGRLEKIKAYGEAQKKLS